MQALQPGAKTALDADTLQSIAGDVPLASLTRDQVVGQPLVQVMVASGLQPTKAASKRMIKVCCCVMQSCRLKVGAAVIGFEITAVPQPSMPAYCLVSDLLMCVMHAAAGISLY